MSSKNKPQPCVTVYIARKGEPKFTRDLNPNELLEIALGNGMRFDLNNLQLEITPPGCAELIAEEPTSCKFAFTGEVMPINRLGSISFSVIGADEQDSGIYTVSFRLPGKRSCNFWGR